MDDPQTEYAELADRRDSLWDRVVYWRPIWHGPNDVTGNWSLTIGHFCLNWEMRYYRTTGLQVWWDDHLRVLCPMTPTDEANKRLNDFNLAHSLRK